MLEKDLRIQVVGFLTTIFFPCLYLVGPMHTSDAHSCLRLWSAISATSPSASVARLTTRPQRALPANGVGRTRPGYVQARHNDLMFSCLWLLAAPVNAPSFRLSCLFCLGRAFPPRAWPLAWPCCWAPRRLCLAPRCCCGAYIPAKATSRVSWGRRRFHAASCLVVSSCDLCGNAIDLDNQNCESRLLPQVEWSCTALRHPVSPRIPRPMRWGSGVRPNQSSLPGHCAGANRGPARLTRRGDRGLNTPPYSLRPGFQGIRVSQDRQFDQYIIKFTL
jgi:hypothetical protein